MVNLKLGELFHSTLHYPVLFRKPLEMMMMAILSFEDWCQLAYTTNRSAHCGQPGRRLWRWSSQTRWTWGGVQALAESVRHLGSGLDDREDDGEGEDEIGDDLDDDVDEEDDGELMIVTNPLGSERNQSERARIRSACTACTWGHILIFLVLDIL